MKVIFYYFRKNRKTTLYLAIFWTIVIFIGCSMPGKELPKLNLFDHFDKIVHLAFFFIFFFLWNAWKRKDLFVFFVAVIYGLGIEIYQDNFVAGRNFDVWDGVADSIGALLAMLMIIWATKKTVN